MNKYKPSEKQIKDYNNKTGNIYIIFQKIGTDMYFKNCKICKQYLTIEGRKYYLSSTCNEPIDEIHQEITENLNYLLF